MRCAYCQTEFTPKHRDRQKCPRRCRLAAWQAGRHQARERVGVHRIIMDRSVYDWLRAAMHEALRLLTTAI